MTATSCSAAGASRAKPAARPSQRWRELDPSPILAALVGIFNTALFVLIRGSAGGQLPLLLAAAILGAWAGDALGDRLGFNLLSIGDFRLIAASIFAWIGIGFVTVVAILGPTRRRA